MGILFFSTRDTIHAQSQKLLLALQKDGFPIYFACLENSSNASFASANAIAFSEISKNSFIQYFSLRKIVKEQKITHIHIFDEKAFNLAKYLKKSFPFIKLITDWHESVDFVSHNPLVKQNPLLFAFYKEKISTLFSSSPEFVNYLNKHNMQKRVGLLPYMPLLDTLSETSLQKANPAEIFTFYAETNGKEESGYKHVLTAFKELIAETHTQKVRLILCVKDDEIFLENGEVESVFQSVYKKAEELGLLDFLVLCDTQNSAMFFGLADVCLCPSSDGEGDYPLLFTAWHKKMAVIASDLSVHTKFILADTVECALLYPRDDYFALCKYMKKIMQDSNLRQKLELEAYTKAKSITLQNLANDYLRTLKLGRYAENYFVKTQ